MGLPMQADASGAGLLAYLVTFLIAWVFYAATLHLAALYVIGDTPHQRATLAAAVPAFVSLFIQQYEPLVVIPILFLTDAVAIHFVYQLYARMTLVLTLAHYAIAAIIGFALYNIITLLALT
ncbi:DUF7473 family protein [Halocatena marina]|uniref:Uncharacterized protein n=1 Tax=Halocatena marina TaxID=2934937 RepID=A0ABD5YPC9_9EURY|nr:hypothetical protein [Halocatena marina]